MHLINNEFRYFFPLYLQGIDYSVYVAILVNSACSLFFTIFNAIAIDCLLHFAEIRWDVLTNPKHFSKAIDFGRLVFKSLLIKY